MLVSKGQFINYRSIFYNKIRKTPHYIELEVFSLADNTESEEFSLESFVGDSPRTSVKYKLQALYEKIISDRMRDKYGLAKEVNGVVYLSPLQLTPILGTFYLDWNKTKIHFNGRVQVINKIIYLEEMYDSCIGIQIFVTDDLKGG